MTTTSRAAAMRDAFDRAFAERPRSATGAHEDLIAVRLGGNPYAIRLAELAALHVDRVLVAVPSSVPELLGIAAFRGVMSAVYDLGALLGYAAIREPRWLATARAAPVALAFDKFEGHVRIGATASPMIEVAGVARTIIDIPSVLEMIERRIKE